MLQFPIQCRSILVYMLFYVLRIQLYETELNNNNLCTSKLQKKVK